VRCLALSLLLIASPAAADRCAVWSVGPSAAGRATGASLGEASSSEQLTWLGGLRLGVAFEDAPPAMPIPGHVAIDARLVPELVTGFLVDRAHAEGYVGAGLRAELQLAAQKTVALRTAVYVAARAIAIGGRRDSGVELVFGEYVAGSAGRTRFGWEGGAMIRPRAQDDAGSRELDAVVSLYLAWQ